VRVGDGNAEPGEGDAEAGDGEPEPENAGVGEAEADVAPKAVLMHVRATSISFCSDCFKWFECSSSDAPNPQKNKFLFSWKNLNSFLYTCINNRIILHRFK